MDGQPLGEYPPLPPLPPYGLINAAWVAAFDQGGLQPVEPTSIPTDYVLVVGAQLIDDDGDRVGGVSYFPKGGSQPPYITAGLLEVARAMLAGQANDD
ncbi:hypothetical protein ONA92_02100 [Mycobacteroides salmoniphilum]|uniref:DUF7213 family protein n=1 Tax=Mycobacteroides salmoniphilum TaxID=404941 RepID=UPI0035685F11